MGLGEKHVFAHKWTKKEQGFGWERPTMIDGWSHLEL